jgi:excisionase family DNA binding protein
VVAKKVISMIDPIVKKNAFRKAVKIQRAAEALDCSRDKIYDLINSGELETVKIQGTTYITIKSLEEIQKAK